MFDAVSEQLKFTALRACSGGGGVSWGGVVLSSLVEEDGGQPHECCFLVLEGGGQNQLMLSLGCPSHSIVVLGSRFVAMPPFTVD